MHDTSSRRPDEGEAGFATREWITVLLLMAALALGASGFFAVAYWLMVGR